MRFRLYATVAGMLFGACAVISNSNANETYPDKPVTIIVPFAVGGPTDTSARLVAGALAKKLNANLVVENMPGAGARIGTTRVAQSKPDGYTLLWGTSSSLAIAPRLYTDIKYDPIKSFEPISMVATGPFILAVRPSLGVKSVKELVAMAKAQPKKLNFASTGQGGSTHLTAELFEATAGISAVHVPYSGGAPAMNALLAGDVDFLFDTPTTIVPTAKSGRILALAVTSQRRWRGLPDIPTFEELGYKNFDASTWFGLLAPAGTPKEIIKLLNHATALVLQDPKITSALESAGFAVKSSTEDEFAKRIVSDGDKWGDLIKSAHIKVE